MLHYLAEKMLQQSILLNITFKHHYVNSTTLSLKNNAVLLLFPQFSRTVGSESLRPHELRHARPPCPSPTPRFTQTHAHWVSDAIQPSHPLSSPSPPAPDPSQHQVFSNESTLHMRWPKYWSFSFSIIPSKEIPELISFRMDWLSKGLSRVFSNTTVQKHQFFSTQLSSQSNCHIHTWPLEKP